MKLKEKNVPERSKKSASSIVLYGAASVVALIAVALLINNIILFNNNVTNYVAQGYLAADVIKQLIPSQLLPGIFEPIALYGGIAFVLLGAGIINQKVSKCLILLTKIEVCNDATEESVLEENVIDEKNMGATKRAETIEEVNETTDNSK
jgi:hypothetical protein